MRTKTSARDQVRPPPIRLTRVAKKSHPRLLVSAPRYGANSSSRARADDHLPRPAVTKVAVTKGNNGGTRNRTNRVSAATQRALHEDLPLPALHAVWEQETKPCARWRKISPTGVTEIPERACAYVCVCVSANVCVSVCGNICL